MWDRMLNSKDNIYKDSYNWRSPLKAPWPRKSYQEEPVSQLSTQQQESAHKSKKEDSQ